MKIETRKLSDIKPYEKNAKKHPKEQIEALAAQITAHGFDVPIVVDAQGVIIKGHGRWAALKKLGRKDAPVIVRTDLSEAQAKAARLADNKLGEVGYDFGLLADEMLELEGLQFDLGLTGWEEWFEKQNSGPDEATGSKELSTNDFDKFAHACPKCGFEFN